MDKNQLKQLVLLILGPVMFMAARSVKLSFALGVLLDMINTYWDEAWDTYARKAKGKAQLKAMRAGGDDDPADHLIAHLQGVGGNAA
jgi:hypothetical protein